MKRIRPTVAVVVSEEVSARATYEGVVVILPGPHFGTTALATHLKPFVDHDHRAAASLDAPLYVHFDQPLAAPNLVERHRVAYDDARGA